MTNKMVQEETSKVEKIIKLFPDENIVLSKNFNGRKPDIWFKNRNLNIEVDERSHENYETDDEKEREEIFEKHNFKTFRCNPSDSNFDLFKFLGEINLDILKLREKNAANKALHISKLCKKKKCSEKAINEIAEDFAKIVAVTKLKELKGYAKNILPKYKE